MACQCWLHISFTVLKDPVSTAGRICPHKGRQAVQLTCLGVHPDVRNMQALIGYCGRNRSPCPHRSRRLASALGPPSGIAPWTQCPSALYAPPPQQSPRRSQYIRYRLHRDMCFGLFAIGPRRMWMDMARAGCVASVSLSLALRGIASTYNRSIKPSSQPNVTWTLFLLFLILNHLRPAVWPPLSFFTPTPI